MSHVNLKTQKFFLRLVRTGYLKVYKSGKVKNLKTGRWIGALGSGQYMKISCLDKKTSKIRHMQVHRLVYLCHGGDIPVGMQINHIDGNKLNNHIDNLETVTATENMFHATGTGLLPAQKGEKNSQSKLTDKIVRKIRVLGSQGYGPKQIVEHLALDCTTTPIYSVLKGTSWTHVK
jgi:hypothetical protein